MAPRRTRGTQPAQDGAEAAREPDPIEPEREPLLGTEANVHQRMVAVKHDVGVLQKRRRQGVGYSFLTWDDVAERVQQLEAKHGLNVVPNIAPGAWTVVEATTTRGNPTWRATVDATFDFINVDAPDDHVVIEWPGQGDDSGDKALQKAGTYAAKYAHLKVYKIGGDDSDETGTRSEDDEGSAAPGSTQQSSSTSSGGPEAWRHPVPNVACPDCGGALIAIKNAGKRPFVGHAEYRREGGCQWRPEWRDQARYVGLATAAAGAGSEPAKPAAADAPAGEPAKPAEDHVPALLAGKAGEPVTTLAAALALIEQWNADKAFIQDVAVAVITSGKLTEDQRSEVRKVWPNLKVVADVAKLEPVPSYMLAKKVLPFYFASVAAADPTADQPEIPM